MRISFKNRLISDLAIDFPEAPNGPHNGQKYVGYNTKRSAGSLRIFVPSERSEC
ncbi:hypothetical protein ACOJR9_02605 [Alteromonas sp. A081]|uniref:hypothetical protein n=1 Tax=Alteromonas sp. A081 TaxID=3410269 RepID=UPI003B986EE4